MESRTLIINGGLKMFLEFDENSIARFNIGYKEFLILSAMFPNGSINIDEVISKLIKNDLIVKEDDVFIFTKKGFHIAELFNGVNKSSNEKKAVKSLAKDMSDIYPKGKKPDTSQYWRGNSKIVEKKLTKFIKDNPDYTEDDILSATKRYIDSFDGSNKLMRVLPYFIEKDGGSDLLSLLENTEEGSGKFQIEELI